MTQTGTPQLKTVVSFMNKFLNTFLNLLHWKEF